MSPVDLPDAASDLFALPPPRFTAERNALARRLAERGDPGAATVRKLARPTGLAWVLNRLAREAPREVEALLAAGDRLRAGQRRALAGGGADELRAAADALAESARALRARGERVLAAEGRAVAPTTLARLELLLRVAATGPRPSREGLRRGVLAREPEIASAELAGFTVVAGGRQEARGRAPAGARHEAARTAVSRASQARPDEQLRQRQRREEQQRQRALAAARRAAEASRARAEREERAAAEALVRARRAGERAAAARAEADRAAAALAALGRG